MAAALAGTLGFTSLAPIGVNQGGILKDALAYKRKQGGALVNVNIRA